MDQYENKTIGKELKTIVAVYFSVPQKLILRGTRVSEIASGVHDEVSFSFYVEKHFDLEFEEKDLEKVRTIGDYVRLITAKLHSKQPILYPFPGQMTDPNEWHHKAA